eukprot:127623-Pelagomonas_calceolata.AAC.4
MVQERASTAGRAFAAKQHSYNTPSVQQPLDLRLEVGGTWEGRVEHPCQLKKQGSCLQLKLVFSETKCPAKSEL